MKYAKLLTLTLLLANAGAWADGPYVVGEVSHSKANLGRSTDDAALTAAGATGLSSSDKGSGNQWRLQLGYQFNPNFALEAGYIDFGKADYSASYTGGSAHGSVKVGGFDLAALGIVPLGDNVSLFGKAGIVAAHTKSSLSALAPAAAASGSQSADTVSPLLGLGASYKISNTSDLRAEYDHVSDLGKSNKTGKLSSDMLSVGLAYHF